MNRGYAIAVLIATCSQVFAQNDPLPQAIQSAMQGAQAEMPGQVVAAEPVFGTGGPPVRQYWFTADYLYSWLTPTTNPPLVTTSPTGTDRSLAAILDQPGTTVLFGGNNQQNTRHGMKLAGGVPFAPSRGMSLEADFTVLFERNPRGFAASSDSNLILGRPFTIDPTGQGQAVLIAFPGVSSGRIEVRESNDAYYNGGAALSQRMVDNGYLRVNTHVGYRFFSYQEDLLINQTVVPIGPAFVPGTNIRTSDHFFAGNTFHGADLGLRTELAGDFLSLELLTKIALGSLRRQVNIEGRQTTTVPGTPTSAVKEGVFALRSNNGDRTENRFGFLPELGVTLKWHVLPNATVRLGYSTTLLQGVVRAGDQIDTAINPNNFPPAVPPFGDRPAFNFNGSNVWIQNLVVGVGIEF